VLRSLLDTELPPGMASCDPDGHVTKPFGPGRRLSGVDPWAADRFWTRCWTPRVRAVAAGELGGRRSTPGAARRPRTGRPTVLETSLRRV
jgi:hypothetical protein